MFTDRGITVEAQEFVCTVSLVTALSHAENLLNIVLEQRRVGARHVRERNLAVGLDEELMEVPLDVLTK